MTNSLLSNHKQTLLYYFLVSIFLLSGFCGLVYESIWSHYLKLFLGHAAYAQVLVLCIYMGGMAVGAWVASLYTEKIKNLFFAYAVIEAVLGVLALVFHAIFLTATEYAYWTLIPSMNNPVLIQVLKWTLASFLILPQCVLLGSTFPIFSAAMIRSFSYSNGKNIGLLYFSNSMGAVVGVLVSGFVLIQSFGLPGTIFICWCYQSNNISYHLYVVKGVCRRCRYRIEPR